MKRKKSDAQILGALADLVGMADPVSALAGLRRTAVAFSSLLTAYALPNAVNPQGMCDVPELFRIYFGSIVATGQVRGAIPLGPLELIQRHGLCVVPPNQETSDWTVYAEFDGEFGFDKQIGFGPTLLDALEIAAAVIEDAPENQEDHCDGAQGGQG
jgi:hypothetical protein